MRKLNNLKKRLQVWIHNSTYDDWLMCNLCPCSAALWGPDHFAEGLLHGDHVSASGSAIRSRERDSDAERGDGRHAGPAQERGSGRGLRCYLWSGCLAVLLQPGWFGGGIATSRDFAFLRSVPSSLSIKSFILFLVNHIMVKYVHTITSPFKYNCKNLHLSALLYEFLVPLKNPKNVTWSKIPIDAGKCQLSVEFYFRRWIKKIEKRELLLFISQFWLFNSQNSMI